MKQRYLYALLVLSVTVAIVSACVPVPVAAPAAPAAATTAPAVGAFKIDPKNLKVAMLLDGPINDQGWNQGAYDGLAAIKTKYQADTAYSESVALADMETVFSDYASRGYNVIVAHGFEFSDAAEKVAPKFPNTIFLVTHAPSSLKGPNVGAIEFDEPQIGFLLGVLAGQMTKSNKVAALGGYKIPAIDLPFQAFKAGVNQVNPKAEVTTSWIDSWTDIAKMKEAGKAAIANGADIVFPVASAAGLGGLDAAKEKNVAAIGYSGDQSSVAPDQVLTSGVVDTGLAIQIVVDKIVDGTFQPQPYWFGLKENVLRLAPYHKADAKIPQSVKDSVEDWRKKIMSGEFTVPVKMEF